MSSLPYAEKIVGKTGPRLHGMDQKLSPPVALLALPMSASTCDFVIQVILSEEFR